VQGGKRLQTKEKNKNIFQQVQTNNRAACTIIKGGNNGFRASWKNVEFAHSKDCKAIRDKE
jgi:hypothetical protein